MMQSLDVVSLSTIMWSSASLTKWCRLWSSPNFLE